LKDVKGKKAILLLATGVDTFSKHTLDQTMKLLRQTDTTIFCVGLDKPYINFLNHAADWVRIWTICRERISLRRSRR